MKRGETGARAVYRRSCPNCGGPITDDRLRRGLPCRQCVPRPPRKPSWDSVFKALRRGGRLLSYEKLYGLSEEASSLQRFFEEAVGSPPWGAQRTWFKRVVRRDSFSIVAPTGVGKTTFGLVAALYYACRRGERSYLVLPTATLVAQASEKASQMASRVGCDAAIVSYHSKLSPKKKAEAAGAISEGKFQVLITTVSYARKNHEALSKIRFRLVFVDDVDAVLKSGKSVDSILRIVGFGPREVEMGAELLRLQRLLASTVRRALGLAGERREELRSRLLELKSRISELEAELRRRREEAATLIVSSATGRPRGSKVKLFRALLGFEVGGRGEASLRRVIDSYVHPGKSVVEETVRIVKMLGSGTLVYVPMDSGIEGAEMLAEALRSAGVRAEAYHANKPMRVLREFIEGELEVLVGVANYYGTLVRGIDLPERVKYAVFAGVPRHVFPADVGEPHPTRLVRILSLLSEVNIESVAADARRHLGSLRRLLRRMSPAALNYIAERVVQGDVDEPGSPTRLVSEAYNFVRRALEDEEVWRRISGRSDVGVVERGARKYLLIADHATYIQASGRTSRLYAGGITLGLSVVVVDDENLLRGLVRRTKWVVDSRWTRLDELDLERVIGEIEADRRRVSTVLRGETRGVDLVRSALLVVESPNKARTIASFFGQPSLRILPGGLRAYESSTGTLVLIVAASGGHVFDLVSRIAPQSDLEAQGLGHYSEDAFGVAVLGDGGLDYKPVFSTLKRCLECGHQFTDDMPQCPVCGGEHLRDSWSVLEDLRRLAWEVDEVLVGTDPDTEGEKIGWDVALQLFPYNSNVKRLEFHEVTREAVLEALGNPRDFSESLVEAQLVRRIEDRWIGFTLSPLLWCDFWPNYYCQEVLERPGGERATFILAEQARCRDLSGYYNLSAGRVQTPTLGWIVSRSEEASKRVSRFRVELADLNLYVREEELTGDQLKVLKEIARGEGYLDVEVSEVERGEVEIPPPPPHSTDSMLSDASKMLGLGAPEAMRIAQDLFEWGLITYHRTDSTRVSDKGVGVARQYVSERFGEELFRARRWGEGGAHEAIRPVRPIDADTLSLLVEEGTIELPGRLTRRHLRLYDLIFRRFMASQMREARAVKVKYRVRLIDAELSVEVERLIPVSGGEGWTSIWPLGRPARELPVGVHRARVAHEKVPKARLYTHGEVIELMKTRGIGRPSTYAKIVETLLRRKYVTALRERGYLVATIRGRMVYRYLTRILGEANEDLYGGLAGYLRLVPSLVSEDKTKELEEYMDKVEKGEADMREILSKIYNEIRPLYHLIKGRLDYIQGGGAASPLEGIIKCLKRAQSEMGGVGELAVEAKASGAAYEREVRG